MSADGCNLALSDPVLPFDLLFVNTRCASAERRQPNESDGTDSPGSTHDGSWYAALTAISSKAAAKQAVCFIAIEKCSQVRWPSARSET